MSTTTVVGLCVVCFYLGGLIGFLFKVWLNYRATFDGNMYISHTEDKTLYSLELRQDPEQLQYQKEVIFKVVTDSVEKDKS